MKVLFYTKKVYEPENGLFTRDRAGLALYVHDLALSLMNDVELYVLTSIPCKGVTVGRINYVRYSKGNFITCITPRSIAVGIGKALRLKGGTSRQRMKEIYWEIDKNYFAKVVKRLNPDLVHIHGCTEYTVSQLAFCREHSIPCIFTSHGLIGIDPIVRCPEHIKKKESEIFSYMDKYNLPVTVISSGIKKRAIEHYQLKNSNNIHVLLNGTNKTVLNDYSKYSLESFGIKPDKRIICCVGSLLKLKNQTSVLQAWSKLDEHIRKQYVLAIAGADLLNGEVQSLIITLELEDSVKYLGFVDREKLFSLYCSSDLNILASVTEGFGLSIIEAMQFGVPTLTYADLDAIEDVYGESCMMLLYDRSIEALTAGIEKALSMDWDRKAIADHSKKFTIQNIKNQYIALYNEITSDKEKK